MTRSEWGRLRVTRGVEGLWEAIHPLSSHHFLDNDLSKPLFSQTMMHSQKVNFNHFEISSIDHILFGHTDDTGHDFLTFRCPNHKVELFHKSGTGTSPSKLLDRIIQSEMSTLVFNVVVHQKVHNFLAFFVICGIKVSPFETTGQIKRLFLNIFGLKLLNLTLFLDLYC